MSWIIIIIVIINIIIRERCCVKDLYVDLVFVKSMDQR